MKTADARDATNAREKKWTQGVSNSWNGHGRDTAIKATLQTLWKVRHPGSALLKRRKKGPKRSEKEELNDRKVVRGPSSSRSMVETSVTQ